MIHVMDDLISIMSHFILYQFISCIYINSTYTYNYHKLFCCTVVAFCAIIIPLVFLMHYGCFCFAYFYAIILHISLTISTSYLAVFNPCKDLLHVNK